MNALLPFGVRDAYVEWTTAEGGLGVVAFTDDVGLPFIGLYPLNRMGHPNGLPCWFQRSRLMSDMAIGFRNGEPVVIFIDAEVSDWGISLIVYMPRSNAPYLLERRLSARWGSMPPRLGFSTCPANSNWLTFPYPIDNYQEE